MNAGSSLILATGLADAEGALAGVACLALALAERSRRADPKAPERPVILFEVGRSRRRPTLLASDSARRLESVLAAIDGVQASARGSLCWASAADSDRLVELVGLDQPIDVVAYLSPAQWRSALDDPRLRPDAVVVRADPKRHASVCALLARELRQRRLAHAIQTAGPGLIGSRRALAGIAPGGEVERKAARLARRLRPGLRPAGEAGQALPLMLGASFVILTLALLAVVIGASGTAAGRVQRTADLAAVSAARTLRDERPHLFEPARLADGRPNSGAISLATYERRARASAIKVASAAGVPSQRLAVRFPDHGSAAPLQVTVEIHTRIRAALPTTNGQPRRLEPVEVNARATAEAVLGSAPSADSGPASASGDYSGPLAYRQGKPMRPDVADAFDRLVAAAGRDGVALTITSAYRSDAEQATLFAAHPDPRWVAPPGVSLHRCGTELDLGPATAYGWLAANASRFGFTQRYAWEAWHYGFTRGPAPCSRAGSLEARGDAGGAAASGGLPSFVPARFRGPIAGAATRFNVPAGLLAAQLMAESGFDPNAVSPAGALGIAQFIPSTAAAYGLRDPFDANAAIQAQARLMAANLKQFGSTELALAAYNAGPAPVAACHCVPPYPETQAYVTRILGLMGGSAEIASPELEVRLVA